MSKFPRTSAGSDRAGGLLSASLCAALSLAGAQAARASEWIPLFNGKDVKQWRHVGDGSFTIEDGLLKTRGGMGLLWYTPQKLENVKLKVVFKGSPASNAGVFIRIPEQPSEPWMPVYRGYEVQIDYTADEYHRTGVLYSFTKALATPPRSDGWNEMLITLDGPRTRAEINGVLITDHREGDPVRHGKDNEPARGPRPDAGYIGLQNHSDKDTIYFKEVSYQPLAK